MIENEQPIEMSALGQLASRELHLARRFSCSSMALDGAQHQALVASLALKRIKRLSASNASLSHEHQRRHFVARKLSLAASQTDVRAQRNGLLSESVRKYIEQMAKLTNCARVHICDGSEMERKWLIRQMLGQKMIEPLEKYDNCWLARTDPRDVARVESRTYICTRNKHDVVPRAAAKQSALANWMHIDELDERMARLLPNCMSGRTMYVIPFSMGPLGSSLAKLGIQLTDSPYVVASMQIMTRVSTKVLQQISARNDDDYVRCLHSVGCPLPLQKPLVNNWPCNPEQTIITHIPERKQIISYGSGYGGNSLLGKKCFALRLGSILGRDEGWLAEHMLILGVTDPNGNKKYIAAAFPSACGKTNLAMMTPSLPGYKVECVGDDIAWMRFDDNGQLRAINPEAGFFGVAPGTNEQSNLNAMKTIERNTIFTNVAKTQDGDFYWQGLEHKLAPGCKLRDWQNRTWQQGNDAASCAAHPNSRFCAPAAQCPIIDPQWDSVDGVPISAIIFGGRRPEGVPLVYEAFDWQHGVFVGASMRSESTAAAEHKAKTIMHDPFAMRPFFGYNFGHYLSHWLSFGQDPTLKLPKIFHVNWFRKDAKTSDFLWPGFGENSRVLDWICRRVDGEPCAKYTPIGLVPEQGALNLNGLSQPIDTQELFSISTDFWLEEQQVIDEYLKTNVGADLPAEIAEQCASLRKRLLGQSDNLST